MRDALRTGAVRTLVAGMSALVGVETVAAHEEYVVDGEQGVTVGEFLSRALTDPMVVGPLVAGALGLLVVVVGYLQLRPFRLDIGAFRSVMAEYDEFIPWLLRISFGIPLIGAGFSGYFISPSVSADLRILQVALGFLLLFGLATRVVALVTLVVYAVGAAFRPGLLLQLEYVGGMVALVLLGSGKPSADHVLQRVAASPGTVYGRFDPVHEWASELQSRIDEYLVLLPVVVRVGLGATFVYLGVGQKLLRPGLPLEVVAHYDLTGVIPVAPELWVLGAALTEAGLGLALIAGAFTRGGSIVAITMFVLTLFALPDDPVLAHVTLFGMASTLIITGGGPYALDNQLEVLAGDLDDRVPVAGA